MTTISNSERHDVPGRSRRRPPPEGLWSVEEVSNFLQVPINTLYQWRHKGTGPLAFRVGRFLRYDPATVRSWLADTAGDPDGLH